MLVVPTLNGVGTAHMPLLQVFLQCFDKSGCPLLDKPEVLGVQVVFVKSPVSIRCSCHLVEVGLRVAMFFARLHHNVVQVYTALVLPAAALHHRFDLMHNCAPYRLGAL